MEKNVEEYKNMSDKSIELDIRHEKDSDKIELICMGDFHYGAKECNLQGVISQIEWIKQNPNARVIFMGDILNCGTKLSVGEGTFGDRISPQEQFELVRELLTPIKDKIYGMHIGNHEQRIMNETGINLIKILANELGTRYLGYSAFHDIRVRNIHYSLFTMHGSSGSTLPHTKIKRCLDLATFIDADIYAMGHVHSLQVLPQEYKSVDLRNKNVRKTKKYFILTGHYLNYEDSYADMKSLIPSKQGCARIRLDGKKKDAHVSV